ncbi:lysine-specific histone demethylase 1A-like [Plutella xylostella]|uniref:lysine-specific histone demethylase 1A-like n=1 Tax=Plutella xylostella TaxID=51655 RepID=UPI00203308EB|nr:lysine-specific histone demethylase 1A-like [Plutella xylostella]
MDSNRQLMDVIVVGCGASGVAALRRLHDAGLKVLGLEAAERVGGRICTVEYGERRLDIGAAWCHGEKDNIVFELANPLDLLGRPNPDHQWFVRSNGDLVPEDQGKAIQDALSQAVEAAEKNNAKSISECVRDATRTTPSLQQDPHLSTSFAEWFERCNHAGGERGKSLRGLHESWGCEGEFMLNWKGRGYATVLDVLLNKHPDPTQQLPIQILLNKEVTSIKWASQAAAAPLVHVQCRDGSLYAAKSLLVTVSVGVLKERHAKLFNPPLPAEKVNTINNLQMCVLDKIYIEFTKPWWPKFPSSFAVLWRPEDKDKFSKEERWITEIYGFNTVEYQPNLLLAWIYGEGAVEMEKVSEEKVKAGVIKLLKVLFSKEFEVTPVKSILRSKWASNPFARGAYAYRSVANEQHGGNAITLSEPLYYNDQFPILCFGGEATSHHRHGAVHGAIEAGFREADRLIEAFKKGIY